MLVARVLVATSGQNAVRRRLNDPIGMSPNKTGFLLSDCSVDFFFGKNEGHERRLSSSVLVGRQPGQAVAAINHLFNLQEQADLILTEGLTVLVPRLHQRPTPTGS